MLSSEQALQYCITNTVPPILNKPAFNDKKPLWIKSNKHPQLEISEITSKRYEYIKIGKTFGLETTRYLTFYLGYLFYFDGEKDKQSKGYCSLQNVYVQWFTVKSNRYLLFISNGNQNCTFFFNTSYFWFENQTTINKYIIQLNCQENYYFYEQIGKGSFSKVFKVKNKMNNKIYAAKIINKIDKHKSPTKDLVVQQRKILRLIDSQYVYKFQELYEQQESFIVIIQYLQGKDLMAVFKEKKILEVHQAEILLKNILQGIRDIHKANIIHRDLKPQNILINLNNMKPCIIDFGLSLHLNESVNVKSFKRCGTMGYMAPQVIQNTGQNKKPYGTKCDIFSFGIIAHMILLGYNPLKGENYDQTFTNNKICNIQLDKKSIKNMYGQHCFIFLTKSLSKYPQFRYDADQALNSLFLKDKVASGQKDKQQSSTVEQLKKIQFQSAKIQKQSKT